MPNQSLVDANDVKEAICITACGEPACFGEQEANCKYMAAVDMAVHKFQQRQHHNKNR